MNRRGFLAALVGCGLGVPRNVFARPPARTPRIGYLVLSPLIEPPSAERAAFLEGLREYGYVDGSNLTIEYRSAEGDPDMLPYLAAELVERKVDLIVCVGGLPALAAKQATRSIPIVMLFSPDPVGSGLVASLARPGGNITGLSHIAPELGAKRLELLKEAVPGIRRVAVLRDSDNAEVVAEWEATQAVARVLNVVLKSIDVAESGGLDAALARVRKDPPDALITIVDLRTAAYRYSIPAFALQHRLPTMAGLREFAVAGGLMSYAPDFADLSRRAARYVDQILKGVDPGRLPVEQPTRYELVVNLKTAKALRLRLPEGILVRADEIIR